MFNNVQIFFNSDMWRSEFLGNTLLDYFYFLGIIFLFSISVFLLKYFLSKKISGKIKEGKMAGLFLDMVNKVRSPFYIFISFYIALSVIQIPEFLEKTFWVVLVFWCTYVVVIIGYLVIDFFLDIYTENKTKAGKVTMIRSLGNIGKVFLWIIAGFILLSLFGVNITALVAGMGVGGIAVAFALQNILSDLFSSFSIYFDKPFVEGDLIVVGNKWGTVEKIGIKSTRVRALQGEQIIFSNKELTTAQVHNFKRLERRRIDFKIGITYETPTKKMEKIPQIISKIFENEELADLDRVHFSAFNDFSLDYTIVYYINSPEFVVFMDINERILLDIKRSFEKEKIDFAYPTNTIHMAKSS
jgi:small-conductance mechanosensitive channel